MKNKYELLNLVGGLSAQELTRLAVLATERASDLKAAQPSVALALAAGVRDNGYRTVRYGWITSYTGEAEITMENGDRWLAVGHEPSGNAHWVTSEGWIEFFPLPKVAKEEIWEEAILAG